MGTRKAMQLAGIGAVMALQSCAVEPAAMVPALCQARTLAAAREPAQLAVTVLVTVEAREAEAATAQDAEL